MTYFKNNKHNKKVAKLHDLVGDTNLELEIGKNYSQKNLDSLMGQVDRFGNQFTNSVTSAINKDLQINPSKVNIDGGALALGHPLGATGARITGKAAQLLRRENKKFALATQCIGLGMGIATIIESV